MSSTVREPAVAGQFYPSRPKRLLREIQQYTEYTGPKISALACVVPHAGYMYSGHVAGATYARVDLPQKFIILCPNHTGMGKPLAIMSEGSWRTPLGNAEVDHSLAKSLSQLCDLFSEDLFAHLSEHALEVQLPFLQVLARDFRFVPITVGTGNLEALTRVGEAMAAAISASSEPVLIISSSDMNHYEDDETTRVKDAKAIEQVLSLDPAGLYETVRREDISMCGYAPTVATLTASKRLGATSAELVRYATSGDISGERDQVVGYAGMVIT